MVREGANGTMLRFRPSTLDMRYLRRRHQFLSDRSQAEVEAQAERYFEALGYRRREDRGGRFTFERGRRLASLWSPLLRRCHAQAVVGYEGGLISVRHRVEVLGRFFALSDADLLDAEARCFQGFLGAEGRPWDAAPLLRARQRALRGAAVRAVALAFYTAAVGLALAWWLGWR